MTYLSPATPCEFDPETHTYFSNGEYVYLYVSRVLSLSGICPPYPPSAAANVEHRRLIGERTHEWARYIDETAKPKVSSLEGAEVLPYVTAYQKFRAECRPEWDHIEESFCREACGGTPDRIGTIRKGGSLIPCVLDIKTAREPAPYWPIQLSAYQWLTGCEDTDLYVVHLFEDASYNLLNYTPHREVWLGALEVARWLSLGRR